MISHIVFEYFQNCFTLLDTFGFVLEVLVSCSCRFRRAQFLVEVVQDAVHGRKCLELGAGKGPKALSVSDETPKHRKLE